MSDPGNSTEVTQLIRAADAGDKEARGKLLEAVYGDLRRLAAHLMRVENPGHTLQPTALVNEFVLRVLADGRDLSAENRRHLISIAAKAMRNLLVDHARGKRAAKRGAGAEVFAVQADLDGVVASDEKLLQIHNALDRLDQLNKRQAKVAELRIFGGLSVAEVAEQLQVTTRTVDRDWLFAKGFLKMHLA
jgi:RNA polymerase sigma factor (TIGR02999 family)